MNVLLFAILVLVVVGLLFLAVDYLPIGGPINGWLKFLILLVAAFTIIQRGGLAICLA